MMKNLQEKLTEYSGSDVYPFHMPGHKRNIRMPADAYQLDITEIDGFDNLHHATGILKEEQEKMAALCGAKQTFFLVNGSTCGILTAISAAVSAGGKLLMARNSHKAAYHAVELRQLNAGYVFPEITDEDIQGAVLPEKLEACLQEDACTSQQIEAVYLTSPTYDGVVSDIRKIADITHKYHKLLIVDEAHGAHFGYHPAFPESAIHMGADLVIQSVHKTLPAFTQSALLHICSDAIDADRIRHYLGIYESSSPSYLLMSGISYVTDFLKIEGKQRFDQLVHHLELFYKRTKRLNQLHVLDASDFSRSDAYDRDISKILISTRHCSSMNGKKLYDILLQRYQLQMEMCSGEYVTALCTLMDESQGFERLWNALAEIDLELQQSEDAQLNKIENKTEEIKDFVKKIYTNREQIMTIADASEAETETMPLEKSCGRISSEYIYLYPPGIPMIVPGEKITEDVISSARLASQAGLELEGMSDLSGQNIKIVCL